MGEDVRLEHVLEPTGGDFCLLILDAEHIDKEAADGHVAPLHLPRDLRAFFGEGRVTIASVRYQAPYRPGS